MSELWARIRRVSRMLRDASRKARSLMARIRALENGAVFSSVGGPSTPFDWDQQASTARVKVLTAAYGNDPIPGADAYFFAGLPSGGNLLQVGVTGPDGRVDLDVAVPFGTPLYVVCFAYRHLDPTLAIVPPDSFASYAGTPVLAGDSGDVAVVMNPNLSPGYAVLPRTVIADSVSGSGAVATMISIQGATVQSPGTGYTGGVGIDLGGYYGSGWAAQASRGVLVGASVTAAGTGYTSAPATTIVPGGSDAILSATAGSQGLLSWSIPSAGSGFTGPLSTTINPPNPWRRAIVGAVANGSGVIVGAPAIDPGAGFINGTAYGATIGGRGRAGSITASVSGGSISGVAVVARGTNFLATPSVTLSGGGGVGAAISLANDPTGIGAIQSVRLPDVFGKFGAVRRPVKLTGLLSTAMGVVDMTTRFPRSMEVPDAGRLYVAGQLVQFGSKSAGWYEVLWAWKAAPVATATVTIASGSLASFAITDPGQGYAETVAIVPGSTSTVAGVLNHATGTALGSVRWLVDSDGRVTGGSVESAGAGYSFRDAFGAPQTSGTVNLSFVGGVAATRDRREYYLRCFLPVAGWTDGKLYPTGASAVVGSLSLVDSPVTELASVRASTYGVSGGVFSAEFDFTGTAAEWAVFQGASPIVTYAEA